jgi:hypothetical protein
MDAKIEEGPIVSQEAPKGTQPEPAKPAESKSVTGRELVDDDNDTFPKSEGAPSADTPAPNADGTPAAPAAAEEKRNWNYGGGRPKGSKDKVPRGRPARADWGDNPMHPKEKKEGELPKDANAKLDPDQERPRPAVDYRKLAEFCVDTVTGVAQQFGGPTWKPQPSPSPGIPGERDMMIGHAAAYFEAEQIKDIPPGWMLVIVTSVYFVPRIAATAAQIMKRRKEARIVAVQPVVQAKTKEGAESKIPPAPAPAPTPAPGRMGTGEKSADFGPVEESGGE